MLIDNIAIDGMVFMPPEALTEKNIVVNLTEYITFDNGIPTNKVPMNSTYDGAEFTVHWTGGTVEEHLICRGTIVVPDLNASKTACERMMMEIMTWANSMGPCTSKPVFQIFPEDLSVIKEGTFDHTKARFCNQGALMITSKDFHSTDLNAGVFAFAHYMQLNETTNLQDTFEVDGYNIVSQAKSIPTDDGPVRMGTIEFVIGRPGYSLIELIENYESMTNAIFEVAATCGTIETINFYPMLTSSEDETADE